MQYQISVTSEYLEWLDNQTAKAVQIIAKRVENIQLHGHFGGAKNLGDGLVELKFKSGIRIYFTIVHEPDSVVILLLGGNKNGQDKDIKKARKFI